MADAAGLLSVILNHQTEAEKAALAQKIAQYQAQAQQQTALYGAQTVEPAAIQAAYGANKLNAQDYGTSAGVPWTSAYGMTTQGRTPSQVGDLLSVNANQMAGVYPAQAGAQTAEASRIASEQPSIGAYDIAKNALGLLGIQHAIQQQPVVNQATDAANRTAVATNQLQSSEAENMLGQAPLINASANQGLVNNYAGQLWQPTARPGLSQSYNMTPEGAITRRYGQVPMSLSDTLTSQMLSGMGGGTGGANNGMLSIGGGKNIPTVIGQVPGMQPSYGSPTLDYMQQSGQSSAPVQNTNPSATQSARPAYGTVGSSLGGQDIDTTPTVTSPPIGANQALHQLGLQLDQNGQLQALPNLNTSPYGGPMQHSTEKPTPEQIRQGLAVLRLMQEGKIRP